MTVNLTTRAQKLLDTALARGLGGTPEVQQPSLELASGRSKVACSRVRAWLSQTPFQP
jgi:hypothetical protein